MSIAILVPAALLCASLCARRLVRKRDQFELSRSSASLGEQLVDLQAREEQLARDVSISHASAADAVFRARGAISRGTRTTLPPGGHAVSHAILAGNAALVRQGLRDVLSLPEALLPQKSMLAWLCGDVHATDGTNVILGGLSSGPTGQWGTLRSQGTYEAITAFVEEVVSCRWLTADDKARICGVDRVGDSFKAGGDQAVGLSILRGIRNIRTQPHVTESLMHVVHTSFPAHLGDPAKAIDRARSAWMAHVAVQG